ncbi:hypothetical protein ACHHYP_00104 [Achlya hypogyna]|uniref:Secreted protein n=1 Tax=Achlya hypogyna TaxID=1202772 RepID=A0A1V9ZBM2_ACHHY|nr:hypothetical protein ACHHYP_00104 [Achlya hypogyna]
MKVAALLVALVATTVAKNGCKHDHRVCTDGSRVYRNFYNDCKFDLCPEDMADKTTPTPVVANVTLAPNATSPSVILPPTPTHTSINRKHDHGTPAATPNESHDDDDSDDKDDDDDGHEDDDDDDDDDHEDEEHDDRHHVETKRPTEAPTTRASTMATATAAPTPTTPKTTQTIANSSALFDANSTANGTEVKWMSINKLALPRPVSSAVARAFVGYNNPLVCSAFELTYATIETEAGGKYHIAVNVTCALDSIVQIAGVFELCLFVSAHNTKDPYHVSGCSYVASDGSRVNYLAIGEANEGVCQTPVQRRAFEDQPLQYATPSTVAEALTSSNFSATLQHISQGNVLVAAVAGIVALVLVVAMVALVRRRRRAKGSQRLGSSAPDVPSAADDLPPTSKSQVEGTFDVTTQTKV